ncbi:MAG TPA: murein L,D-transpeptidase catalytic domain family protein [Chryseosolibacter sp.]
MLKTASTPGTGNGKTNSLTRVKFEDSITQLYDKMDLSSYNLDYKVFRLGMIGYYSLLREGVLENKDLLTIIDFALPSTQKRFFTLDLKNLKVKYNTYVAHGKNTGENLAKKFSNIPQSNQSSLGFYVTGETYVGSKGYSLRLDGMEKMFNGNIRDRAVVVHGADYVSESWIARYGRLGRSQGCPALPKGISHEVIDAIKDKAAIFTYYPDAFYLNSSKYLKLDNLLDTMNEEMILTTAMRTRRAS